MELALMGILGLTAFFILYTSIAIFIFFETHDELTPWYEAAFLSLIWGIAFICYYNKEIYDA